MQKKFVIVIISPVIAIILLFIIFWFWPQPYRNVPIFKEMSKEFKIANRELAIGETKWITLKEPNEGDIFLLTTYYIGRKDLEKIIASKDLINEIIEKIGANESCHVLIIKDNRLKCYMPTGFHLSFPTLYTKAKKVSFRVKKIKKERTYLEIVTLK